MHTTETRYRKNVRVVAVLKKRAVLYCVFCFVLLLLLLYLQMTIHTEFNCLTHCSQLPSQDAGEHTLRKPLCPCQCGSSSEGETILGISSCSSFLLQRSSGTHGWFIKPCVNTLVAMQLLEWHWKQNTKIHVHTGNSYTSIISSSSG